MILGSLGASGADLAKKLENVLKICLEGDHFGVPFGVIIAKIWALKNRLFFRPCIFGPKSAQGPPK